MAMVTSLRLPFQSNFLLSIGAMNFGSIGVLVAQKLFSSIDGSTDNQLSFHLHRVHSINVSPIPDWWSSSTANAYNSSRQCLVDYYRNTIKTLSYNINNEQVSVQLTGEPFSRITLRHIAALRFAYTTLKKSDIFNSLPMPGTKLTNEQTFFLAYAQSQCYQRQDLIQYRQTQSGIYDERTALNAVFVHMPEFVKVFQCQSKEQTCF